MAARTRPERSAGVVLGLALSSLPAALTEVRAQVVPVAQGGAPPAAAVAPALTEACRSMGMPLVSLVCACVFVGSLAVMCGVFRSLRRQGWSIANALSEPTRLLIPDQAGWSDSQGDREAVDAGGAAPVTRLQVMEASSSRLIALLGSIAILLLYLGFGVFTLFDFGLTCTLPATLGSITNFLYAGLALFAPYVANKVASLFRPVQPASSAAPVALAAASGELDHRPVALAPSRGADAGDSGAARVPPASAMPAVATILTTSLRPPGAPAVGGPVLSDAEPRQRVGPAAVESPSRPLPAPMTSAPVAAPHEPGPGPARPLEPARSAVPPRPATPPRSAGEPRRGARSGAATLQPDLQPAVELIAEFEGFVDHAYPDPASGGEPWTIGYGFTRLDGRPVRPGDQLDRAAADSLLAQGVAACDAHLAGRIPFWAEMADDMCCALISFAWNLGQDFYGDEADFATITRVLRDRDWPAVPGALCLYINPGSSVSAGLLRRRRAEGALWTRGLASLAAGPTAEPSAPAPQGSDAHGMVTPALRSHANPLVVPWFDQLKMDDGEGWRDCFSASSAMLAAYWHRVANEDTYNRLRERYGDSTSAEAQLDALRQLGLQADFRTDGTEADLRIEIDAGRPVAVGWLHHGPASDPSGGGHWTVVIGYDATGVIMNDPYGDCDLINGGYPSNDDGAGLHYSYRNWLPRWRVGGSGGWMLTCRP